MKISKVIELLRCERECVFRNSNGCDRNCDRCDLVQNDLELIEMYDFLISMMEIRHEAVEPEVEVLNEIDRLYRCPKCHKCFFYEKQKYCDQCGQAVKWNEKL